MKVLKWIFIVLIALLAILVIIGFASPRELKVTTTAEINLPPAKVFHFVAGFVDRTAWDPWIKADTAAKVTFDIVPGYVGSKYNWEGPTIGKGLMIVDSVATGSYLRNSVSLMPGKFIPEEWKFTPSNSGTAMEWTITMTSGSPFGRLANRAFKGIIQKTMDSGKADLKNYLETNGVLLSKLTEIGIEEYPAVEALTVSAVMTMTDVAAWFGQSMGRLMSEQQAQNLQPQGMPFARYEGLDPATGKFSMIAGVPVSAGGKTKGDIRLTKYGEFTALKGLHNGPYDELSVSYGALQKYAADNGLELNGIVWEYYLSDPAEATDPTQLLTMIAMELKLK
ncbi:MAG: SRPBCC family protein [Bacteroidales bacterium]|jgi:effector-binding domain-containing protein|nr:SRPBCC family protein [Bacteroidales bacterium]